MYHLSIKINFRKKVKLKDVAGIIKKENQEELEQLISETNTKSSTFLFNIEKFELISYIPILLISNPYHVGRRNNRLFACSVNLLRCF